MRCLSKKHFFAVIFFLQDRIIGLTIPVNKVLTDEVLKIKDRVAEKLNAVNHKYLILIDYAFSDKKILNQKTLMRECLKLRLLIFLPKN